MKKKYAFALIPLLFLAISPHLLAQEAKNVVILYLNPEIYPPIEDIKSPTYLAFQDALSDVHTGNLLHADSEESYDNIDVPSLVEYARNNNADYVLVPKIKYFKVGIGHYILSNQVEVSMKLLDKNGNFILESVYNTYKKNMRILGTAENSIKKGTKGAIKDIFSAIRQNKKYITFN